MWPDNGVTPPRLLDAEEVAEALGCGRTFVYELMARGELPSVKLGRLTRVPVECLHEFIADRLKRATP